MLAYFQVHMAPKNRSYVKYQKVSHRDDDGFINAQVG